MPSYETFDWLLWIRPIESLLGVNSVPSHASGEHAWVSWHRYQPPPLFIRSPTSSPSTPSCQSQDQYSWPNIHIYDRATSPPPPPSLITTQALSPHLSHTEIQHALFGLQWDFLVPLSKLQAYPKHIHTHTHKVWFQKEKLHRNMNLKYPECERDARKTFRGFRKYSSSSALCCEMHNT